jgi:hypothetical protein
VGHQHPRVSNGNPHAATARSGQSSSVASAARRFLGRTSRHDSATSHTASCITQAKPKQKQSVGFSVGSSSNKYQRLLRWSACSQNKHPQNKRIPFQNHVYWPVLRNDGQIMVGGSLSPRLSYAAAAACLTSAHASATCRARPADASTRQRKSAKTMGGSWSCRHALASSGRVSRGRHKLDSCRLVSALLLHTTPRSSPGSADGG